MSSVPTICGVGLRYDSVNASAVLDTDELLARLKERGVRNVDIARALDLPDSRVPEIRDKRRALKLDEAAKLVRAFSLEQDAPAIPLHPQMLRLVVRYVAAALGVPVPRLEADLEELTEVLRSFSIFVADPKIRQSPETVEAFFRAMEPRHPRPEPEAPPESDPERTH